jgi:nucleosome binding factor SPN SPT16 subunit
MLAQKGYVLPSPAPLGTALTPHRPPAKILAQIQTSDSPIPVEVLLMEKGKDAPSTALATFAGHFATHKRVGHLAKDSHTGKIIDDWNAAVKAAESQPDLVDMGPSISAVLCVKDDEELVRSNDNEREGSG